MKPEDIISVVEKISNLISPAAQQVWGYLYKQQIVVGWTDIVLSVVFLAASVFLIVLTNAGYREESKNSRPDYFLVIVFVMVSLLAVTAFVTTGLEGIKHLANPGYYTVMELLSQFS